MIKNMIKNRTDKIIGSILLFVLIKLFKKYINRKSVGNSPWNSVNETNGKMLKSALKILEYERSINNKYK